jgi:hypothetical protein
LEPDRVPDLYSAAFYFTRVQFDHFIKFLFDGKTGYVIVIISRPGEGDLRGQTNDPVAPDPNKVQGKVHIKHAESIIVRGFESKKHPLAFIHVFPVRQPLLPFDYGVSDFQGVFFTADLGPDKSFWSVRSRRG